MNEYKVWDPDNGDEDGAKIIQAISVTCAAAKYAEKHDSDSDYRFSQGDDGVNLLVKRVGNDLTASVIAYGEQTIVYRARMLNERDFE